MAERKEKYKNVYTPIPETDFLDALIKAGIADSNATRNSKPQKIDFNASNNSTWDLRKYGIEGDWRTNNIYDSVDLAV